jgi:hypothetical protein
MTTRKTSRLATVTVTSIIFHLLASDFALFLDSSLGEFIFCTICRPAIMVDSLDNAAWPEGLLLIKDFVSEEEEEALVDVVDGNVWSGHGVP